jgi:hypothetical protein
MKLNIKRLQVEGSGEIWNSFCQKHPDAWANHFAVPNVKTGQCSFILCLGDEVIAICPLIIEIKSSHNVGSLMGLSLPAPLVLSSIPRNSKLWKKIFEFILNEFDDLAKHNDIKHISYDYYLPYGLILSNELKNDYILIAQTTNFIDLSSDVKDIFAKFTKGHKANIKKSEEKYLLKWITNKDLSNKQEWSKYAEYFDGITSDNNQFYYDLFLGGFLEFVFCYEGNILTSCSAFIVHGTSAIYDLSTSIRNTKDPSHHMIIFAAIKRYKLQKIHFLELGIVAYSSNLNYILNSKKLAIRKFKSGFQPQSINRSFTEKFFDNEYYEAVMASRVSKVLSSKLKNIQKP